MERVFYLWVLCFASLSRVLAVGNGSFYQLIDNGNGNYDVVETPSEKYVGGSIAVAWYEKSINHTGWDYLDIKTNETLADEKAAYAAGFLEGYLTAPLLKDHFDNLDDNCNQGSHGAFEIETVICGLSSVYMTELHKNVAKQITAERMKDEYWYQALGEGYMKRNPSQKTEFAFMGWIYTMTLSELADISEIVKANPQALSEAPALKGPFFSKMVKTIEETRSKDPNNERYLPPAARGEGLGSALVKLVPGSDLYVAHNSWKSYSSMLRIQKRITLPFRRSQGQTKRVSAATISMSAYPGTLSSGDDYYLTSSGLAIMQTAISNANLSLWQSCSYSDQVPTWMRVLVANRLATDGKSWTEIFNRYNSGTYNSQWMVVDYNKYKPTMKPSQLPDGLLWVAEQLPGIIVAKDQTEALRKDNYWASYGVPAFSEIYSLSENEEVAKKYGDWFSFDKNPLARIFRREQGYVTNMKTMFNLMRYNNYQNDSQSVCDCQPPYSGTIAIAGRSDVNNKDGRYPFPALGHRLYGAIDTKITSVGSFKNKLSYLAVSGPVNAPNKGLPVFQWSTSSSGTRVIRRGGKAYNVTTHASHPDTWNFEPVVYQWEF